MKDVQLRSSHRGGLAFKVLRAVGRRVLTDTNRTRLAQARTRLRLLFFKKDVGRDTYIDRTVQVLGWSSISVGAFTAISEGTWLNVNVRTAGHKHIVIGDNCYIGRRNFFTSGWQIVVSDYCMTGVDCKLMSSDHSVSSPLIPYVVSQVTNDKVIRLGVNARLGAGVSVVGNVSIGHGSVVGAGTLVTRDIPPFSIAMGSPCHVTKRYDFLAGRWIDLKQFGPDQEAAIPDEMSYHAMLRATHPRVSIPLQAAGRSFGDML